VNYLLVSIGQIPRYMNECIKNIKKIDSESSVYVITDSTDKVQDAKKIDYKTICSAQTKKIKSLNIYKNTSYEKNPLWINSLLRIFLLKDIVEHYQLEDNIHFDSDVLIYQKFDNVCENFKKDKFNITKLASDRLIFGYSYFKNFEVIDKVCNEISNYLEKEISKDQWVNNPKNEMQILSALDNRLFNFLPSYPEGSSEYIFDGATYGQIVGGTHSRPRRYAPLRVYKKGLHDNRLKNLPRGGWLDTSHDLTEKFLNDKSRIQFIDKTPYLIKDGKKYKIVNLHIHSKELHRFI